MDENKRKKYGPILAIGLIAVLAVGIFIGYLISGGNDDSVPIDSIVVTDGKSGLSKTADNSGTDTSVSAIDSSENDNTPDKAEAKTEDKSEGNTADKAEDKTEGNIEDKTGDNSEGNADKAEDKTGDNSEGNTADKTEDKSGDRKADSPVTETGDNTADKTDAGKTGTDKTDAGKTGTDKTDAGKTGTDKTDAGKTGTDKTDAGKTGTDKTDAGKTGTDKTDAGKTGTDKTDAGKTGTDKTDAGKTGTDKTDSGKTGTDKNKNKNGYVLTYSSDNSWQNGNVNMFGMQFGVTNSTSNAVGGWTVVLTIDGLSQVEGWNGSFSISGNEMTIKDAGYNADIYANGTITFGCNLGVTASTVKVTKATLNGTEMTVQAGKVDQNNQNNNLNNDGNGGNGGSSGNVGSSGANNDSISSVDVSKLLERSKAAVQGDDWLHTDGRKILDKNGKQVWLTGLNWFGYNTGTNTFDGLWNSQLEPTVKAIADHGFNLIRVPISAELINQWSNGEYPKANYNNAYNTALNSMNSLEIWDYFLTLAEASGIKVMPDIHSAETNASGHNVNLWYTNKVTVKDYYHALEWMAERYKNNDTIIAFDLKNEPHGKPYEGAGAAVWNDSKADNNWKYVAETAASKILAKNPNVLILIEGIEIYPMDLKNNSDYHSTNDKEYFFNWWGGNLRGVKDFPVNLGKYQNKLVYSPHDYGPTVYQQPWFEGSYDFDSLMKDCWHDNWFFIYEDNIAPLLIGEWGGFMTEPNITWMTYMRKLISKYHLNHTFWCLNANSGDTGGLLLDDFKTWDTAKYNFVKEVLWQENGKFVGLDHAIALGDNGISLSAAKGLK